MMTKAYAAFNERDPLGPFQLDRRDPRPTDVDLQILYCGVCHSDLHQVRNEWNGSKYPMVPGHEIVGRVLRVGKKVSRFKEGDFAAVGVMVDSCRVCQNCQDGLEQYCAEGMTGTYNAFERDGLGITQGGYSTRITTDERYVYRLAANSPSRLPGIAPLLCAGITTYSPLRFAGVRKGMQVGIIGLGGLGHLGVKFAASFGSEVTVISSSRAKETDARRLGAANFLLSTDTHEMEQADSRFDVILNTVSANHDYEPYLNLLRFNGRMLIVGLPSRHPELNPMTLLKNRRSITGSMIGGVPETQEMLDYCAAREIVADTELIRMQEINEAYERMVRGDVRYRFVIDLASLSD